MTGGIECCLARPRALQRGPGTGEEVGPTAHSWLVELRVFSFRPLLLETEPNSHFKRFAPRTTPVTRHTFCWTLFVGYGLEKARERPRARITATVLDPEREMPKIRAYALHRWKAAVAGPRQQPRAATRGQTWSGTWRVGGKT